MERYAGAAYKALLATLNTGYTAALDREMAAATKVGKLNDVLVFREEKQRIAEGKGLPPEDLDALPESLKKLRATWRSAEAGYASSRDAKTGPLFDTYDKALAAFQTELTQQNKIEDAQRVKAARDEMAKRRESPTTTAGQPPQPATPAKASANVTSTTNERSSSWRRLAEWVLRNTGGSVVYVVQGARMSAREVKDLPAGRFDITDVLFGDRGMDAITDDDMTRLAGNREIETLRINAPKVTLKGLAVLKELPKLKDITISRTPLGDGFIPLLTGLKELTKLQIRDFEKGTLNGIGDLASLSRLQSLEAISKVVFDDADFAQIGKLKGLTSLHMQGTFEVTAASMVSLSGLTRLEDLMMSVSSSFPSVSLLPLSSLSRLKTIFLSRIGFRTTDGSFIGKLPALETAALDNCSVTDELVASWDKCTQLSSLSLQGNLLTGTGLAQLASVGKLKTLSLVNCTLSEEGGMTISSLPALEWLSISKVSDATLHNICQSRTITKLTCTSQMENMVTASMIAEIKTMPALEKLDLLLKMEEPADLEPLVEAGKLRELLLQYHPIDASWSPHLGKLQQLTRLYMRDSKFTDADLVALGKLLPKCRVTR